VQRVSDSFATHGAIWMCWLIECNYAVSKTLPTCNRLLLPWPLTNSASMSSAKCFLGEVWVQYHTIILASMMSARLSGHINGQTPPTAVKQNVPDTVHGDRWIKVHTIVHSVHTVLTVVEQKTVTYCACSLITDSVSMISLTITICWSSNKTIFHQECGIIG